jgi:subtilase family serine protease
MTTKWNHLISDQALINAAHPSNTTGKPWNVVYSDGTIVVLRATYREAARVMSVEYGARFLNGAKMVDLRLLK